MSDRPMEQPILNIHPVGMDERSHRTLGLFFEHHLAGRCALSDEHHAHAVLLDLDGYGSGGHLDRHLREHPERPLIVLSLNDSCALPTNAILIKKPVTIGALADALRELGRRLFELEHKTAFSAAAEHVLHSHLAHPGESTQPARVDGADAAALYLGSEKSFFHLGMTPDLDLAVPEQRSRVFYDPGHCLQGHIGTALALSLERRTAVRLSGAAFRHLDIFGGAGKALVPISGSTLYAASRLHVRPDDVAIEPLPDAGPEPADGNHVESTEVLMWKVALWASKGRVPIGTDLDQPVFMRRWPNLTRLLAPPHATRIASLWMHRPFGLIGTIAALDVPQRLVFAFYSACVAIGVAAPTRRAADMLVAPEPPRASERRGLFRQLLNKLMLDWND